MRLDASDARLCSTSVTTPSSFAGSNDLSMLSMVDWLMPRSFSFAVADLTMSLKSSAYCGISVANLAIEYTTAAPSPITTA